MEQSLVFLFLIVLFAMPRFAYAERLPQQPTHKHLSLNLLLIDVDANDQANLLSQEGLSIPVEIRGVIGGKVNSHIQLNWTIGTPITLPREGTQWFTISFPKMLVFERQGYIMDEPIFVTMSGFEHALSIDMPLKRLAQAEVLSSTHPKPIFDRFVEVLDETHIALLPGARMIHAPHGYQLDVVLFDDRKRSYRITQPFVPEQWVELSAQHGWSYVINVVPSRP